MLASLNPNFETFTFDPQSKIFDFLRFAILAITVGRELLTSLAIWVVDLAQSLLSDLMILKSSSSMASLDIFRPSRLLHEDNVFLAVNLFLIALHIAIELSTLLSCGKVY